MHTVTGNLRKAPYIKQGVGQNGESTLFIVELSEMIKDRSSGEKTYTNYSASLFAKGAQAEYYSSVLVEGNYIVVQGDKLLIKTSPCGKYTKNDMQNARLMGANYIGSGQSQSQAPQSQPQQGGYGTPPPQQQPPQQQRPASQPQQQRPAPQQSQYGQQPQGQQGTYGQPQNQPQGRAPTGGFDDDLGF